MSLSNNFPAIKPSLLLDFANTKALDPRVTFTRSTTATYYDGVTTALAEQNLVTWSQDFDNAVWSKTNTTVTANSIAAPDGNTTADTITATASASSSKSTAWITGTTVTTSYASSVYIKAGTLTKVGLREAAAVGNWATFDVSGGTVIANAAGVTASITNVGNGWYRCQMINPTTGTVNLQIILLDSAYTNTNPFSYTWTSVGTETLYVWGAQIENRNSVTAYTATTTQPITNYIPVLQTAASGVPRFDHNPTTDESLGLLIEEQRTNLILQSAAWDNIAWTFSAVTVTANTAIAPDGTLTADKLISDTASGFHSISQNQASKTASTAYTFSFYAKAGEIGFCVPNFSSGLTGAALSCLVNLSTGAITGVSAGLTTTSTSVGNGWWRITLTATGAANTNSFLTSINTTDASGNASHAGNGFSGIYVWGAQLEAGAFATSYIPTVASTVTRNADAASMTGTNFSSWFSAPEGTLYAEAYLVTGTTLMGISDGSTSNRIQLSMGSSGNQFLYIVGGVIQALFAGPASTTNAFNKVIFGYKTNDFAGTVNAGAVTTDTSGIVTNAVNQLQIGSRTGVAEFANAPIRKIAYYPMRLTNAQLQALTS